MKTALLLLAFSSSALAQATGTFRYQNRTYDDTGITGTEFRPIRQAEVDILQAGTSTVLGSGTTSDTGTFSVSFAAVPPGEKIFARIYARRAGGGFNASVRNNAAANAVYTVSTAPIDPAITTDFLTVDITIGSGGAPAFNIFDCAIKTYEYLATLEGVMPAIPPPLTVYWQSGSSNGTYFDPTPNAIFLLGTSSDPDEYDDDIILHEMGHWAAHNYSKDDTLGGAHTVIDQLDPRTSWSEGWAHYWSAIVRRFVNSKTGEYPSPQTQVDTFNGGHSVFDLEAPSYPLQAIMATNELAVGSVLWHIPDTLTGPPVASESDVWKAVHIDIPLRAQITLEDFHAGLANETAATPGIIAAVTGSETTSGIFKSRSIRYYPDGSETNDTSGSPASLPLGATGLKQRTLFPVNDEDWYQVDATPGTLVVETRNLGDGGDTLMQLYDASGTTLLAANDNRSATDHSSQITQLVALNTTYRVRVLHSGSVIEYGYYDIRAQIVVNGPPSIASITASATSGTAPLQVTFSAAISDADGGAHEFQWDFDGDGRPDWSSLRGPKVTTTYDEAGIYTAQLRVIDSGDSLVTGTVLITVLPSAPPTVSVTPTIASGAAPLAVTFNAATLGFVPSAFAWDFDGDGTLDAVSVATPSAQFTFRAAGVYVPSLVVHDAQGRAFRTLSTPITVTAASPPSVSSFTATSGFVPFASTFTVNHSDPTGGSVEFDVDGDGRFDVVMSPGSASSTTFFPYLRRAGAFTARVRVQDASGLTAESTAAYVGRIAGARGWLVDPAAGDRLWGPAVTLTAEAVPEGTPKKIQFQYRTRTGPGPWIDIGGPIHSSGTLFTRSWNVTGLPDLSTLDLRILIDGSVSSGDTADAVVIDSTAPTIQDDGAIRQKTVQIDRTWISRNKAGVWAIVPLGATADALPLRLEPGSRPEGGGESMLTIPSAPLWRVEFGGTFTNAFQLRIPFQRDGTNAEIRHFDESAREWRRVFFPRVSHADGWVEADVVEPGLYALFEPHGSGDAGGSCSASAAVPGRDFSPLWLLLGILALLPRRRPC